MAGRSLAAVPGSSAPQWRLAAVSSGGAQRRCPAAGRPERPAWYLFRARVRSLGGRAAPASPASRPLASPSRSPPLRRCEGERAGKRAFEKKRGTDGGTVVLLSRLRCGRRVFGVKRARAAATQAPLPGVGAVLLHRPKRLGGAGSLPNKT